MPTFMMSLNWTDQGIAGSRNRAASARKPRAISPRRWVSRSSIFISPQATRDLVLFVDAPNGDNVAKFALALGSLGNVRTRTGRAWTAAEFMKLVSELP